MHTTHILNSSDFTFAINGHEAVLEEVLPGFNERDRIGIVVNDFCGAIGASALIMAAVTKFYDAYRSKLGNEKGKLRIYPEYFTFHIGQQHGDHRQMDIWPSHREVVVENNAEKILQAINDRAITRLLVPDGSPARSVNLLRETISSAEHRIITTQAYSPTGRVTQTEITANTTLSVEKFVLGTVKKSFKLGLFDEINYEKLKHIRQSLVAGDHIKETYRTIPLTKALHMLT